jgi:hypothetical protein
LRAGLEPERDPISLSGLRLSDRALAIVFASIFVRGMILFGRTMLERKLLFEKKKDLS